MLSTTACFLALLFLAGNGEILSDRLLQSYDPRIVPKPDPQSPVTISVDISLTDIVDLDEKHQHIHTVLWIRQKWRDTKIAWNVSRGSDFENVTYVQFKPGQVWTPDVYVYNEVGLELGRDRNNYLIHAQPDGSMRWPFPRSLVTACPLDPKYFPYDTQTCTIIVGSWGHTMNTVNVVNEKTTGDISTFTNRSEWKVKSISIERKLEKYNCCPDAYSVLYFKVNLQRAHDFYIFNLVFSCILISLVNVFGFLLPVPSGERISLNITALLGLIVFMIIVSEMMPPQADVIPNISIYFGISLSLIALANLLNIFIVHLHFRGSHGATMSAKVRHYLVHRLGTFLLYKQLIEHAQLKDSIAEETNLAIEVDGSSPEGLQKNKTTNDKNRPSLSDRWLDTDPEDTFGDMMSYMSVQKQMRCGTFPDENHIQPSHLKSNGFGGVSTLNGDAYRDSVSSNNITRGVSPKPKARRSKSAEWKALAMVLDRLIFIVLLCVTLVNNLVVLLTGL